MRAKVVNEQMDFERNIDPKTAMGLGKFPKNPIPKFMEEVDSLLKNPEKISFTEFNKSVFRMREDFIVMSLREALEREFGLPVIVSFDDYGNAKVSMDLSDGYSLIFSSSESKGSWDSTLRSPSGNQYKTTSSTNFSTLPGKIRNLLKKNNIKI